MTAPSLSTYDRAANTGGWSQVGIYRMVADFLRDSGSRQLAILDIACGIGNLRPYIAPFVATYEGADIVRYPDLPADVAVHLVDLDSGRIPVADDTYDAVISVETIEHLENPRAFVRELKRLAKPGGWILVTTPNQLGFLSKLTLVFKNHYTYFGTALYPGHITALIEIDLRRIAGECGLVDVRIVYGNADRIILTPRHFPDWMVRFFPRACSGTVMLAARKPAGLTT